MTGSPRQPPTARAVNKLRTSRAEGEVNKGASLQGNYTVVKVNELQRHPIHTGEPEEHGVRPERNSQKITHWAPHAAGHVTTHDMPISWFLWVGDPDGLGWVLYFRPQSRPEPSEGSCTYWQLSGPCWLRDHGPRVLAKWDSGYGIVLDQSKHKRETVIKKKAKILCNRTMKGRPSVGDPYQKWDARQREGLRKSVNIRWGPVIRVGHPQTRKPGLPCTCTSQA